MVSTITTIRVVFLVLVISIISSLFTSCVPLEEDTVTAVSGPTESDNSTSDTTPPTVSGYSPLESGATAVSNIVSISFMKNRSINDQFE